MAIVHFTQPVTAISGRVGNSQMVFFARSGKGYVRSFTLPANPNSSDQAQVRAYLTAAAKQWSQLTDVQRQAWQEYAAAYFTTSVDGKSVTPKALNIYTKIAFYRQAQGLVLPGDAPAAGPPAPLTGFTAIPADEASEYSWQVQHSLADVTGYTLLARITAPVLSPAITPRVKDLRYIAGTDADSFIALPVGGSNANFLGARFSVPDGGRYLAELTVLSPDAVPSLPLSQLLTRTFV